MPDHRPSRGTIAAAIVVPLLLILLGAGCFGAADELASESVQPEASSGHALNKAKVVTTDEQAKENEDMEAVSDDVTVAMIVTEGHEPPDDATLLPGTIGCNDRVALVKYHRAAETDSVVSDALATLFSVGDASYDTMYNGLSGSQLSVDKIQSEDGVTTEVWLKGKVTSGGVCDDPRIKAQIEQTIAHFKPKYKIFLNDSESDYRCIGDESGKCE